MYPVPEDATELFALYRKVYDLTGGSVTPLIGDVLVSLGYEPHRITMHVPAVLDIGAGGKGHLIDIIGRLLEREGIMSYVIEAGGDILQKSVVGTPLRVGLEDPRDATQVLGVAEIINRSICGSAGNRRAWNGFHHIVDPFLLSSPTEISAVWVVADTAFLADILTTALFFASPDTLAPHFDFTYAFVSRDGVWTASPDFPGEFFST